ncbi:A/G-specific adenine glycosylase [Acidithiobacillus sp. AMEEHan]|uniref:A/G-specific adenine glycosylase n=1 Tax=Acidithiobacillus sp. AMEEHan TaxID=2994951 RepID=UPI0027E3EDCB|nr:A/G-specific adenine glycosylase [Acidithiobacillus sp. AMEEHan]
MTRPNIASRLLPWYWQFGRHDLPWRQSRDPYPLYLAEVMLQQTRVETVKPYFHRFLARFPSWQALADASLDEVLSLWSGLGYYARARNAHAAAQMVVASYHGQFPADLAQAVELPGVGRSTAAAVLASAYGQRQAILDANARRVLFRYHGLTGNARSLQKERLLWQLAEQETPAAAHEYNQAIQDLGALLCLARKARCGECPLHGPCAGPATPTPLLHPDKPVRFACFLLLRAEDGRVLLEKRPNRGIWGGLWALPWYGFAGPDEPPELAETLHNWAQEEYALRLRLGEWHPWKRHTFTHFHLEYQVVEAGVSVGAIGEARRALSLFAPEQLAQLALPSPLRRLFS